MDEPARLIDGARGFGLELSAADAARLLRLLDELARWNRAYNLTAIADRGRMLTHHLLDSLSVQPYLHGDEIADAGTGAGFPGLPLAVVNPQCHFTLIDSGGKKIRFLAHAVRVLELSNVTPLHVRVESLRPERPFDTVLARAFAPLPELIDKVAALCGPDTRVLAMKGEPGAEELGAIAAPWQITANHALTIPGVDESRHLVVLRKS
jgi:16S rRNA (guanine527-N7)-methyltransferase